MNKRICFLMDSIFSFGGVQRVTAVIAKELAKDYNITIITMDEAKQKDTSIYDLHTTPINYRFFNYPTLPKWKDRMCKAYSYFYRKILPQCRLTSNWYAHSSFPSEKRDALAMELMDGHYDVIIGVHAPLAVRLAACKPLLPQIKLIGWIHNSYEALFKKGSTYIGPELKSHYEWQLEKLDRTIVLCQYDAQQYHFPTTVIYNPLTVKPEKPSTGTSKRFLAVGRFSHLHKGIDLLIEAFNIFAKKNNEWTLDIVGEGIEESLYRELIRKYHLEERITIHPFTNHIQSFYSNAQVYVLSSRWEGFGLVLVEAMAHGLPIVSSDLPTSREIMGNFGLYFTIGDINNLSQQLMNATLINWPQKSQEALQIANRFNINNIISKWKCIIDE